MTRFFVDPDVFDRDTMVLSGENAQHAKVLRLKEGEIILVCDGQGQECVCRVSQTAPETVLSVEDRRSSVSEPVVDVSV